MNRWKCSCNVCEMVYLLYIYKNNFMWDRPGALDLKTLLRVNPWWNVGNIDRHGELV